MTAIAPPARRWVFGPLPDLLFGCGLGYVLLIATIPWLPLGVEGLAAAGLIASLVFAAPHYGATLVRVYGHRRDRRKYAFFAVWASAIVWLGFVFGLHDVLIGSFLITLYFTWSPWHYTGQNYGLAVMFLRRAGVPFSVATKRLLYGSFVLSYVLTFLYLHQHVEQPHYGLGSFAGTPYRFLHLGIPDAAYGGLFGGILAVWGALLLATGVALVRSGARPADLVPLAALEVLQALWFAVPYTWAWATGTLLESKSVAFLFIWAIVGHSVQYLWITTYYAVGGEGFRARLGYWLAVLAAGSAVWTLPALVFAPGLLGTHAYGTGLFLMVAAAVNLHHFILDGAIWKLRDTGVGSVLLAAPAAGEDDDTPRSRPLRAALWTVGLACTALAFYGAWQSIEIGAAARSGDVEARLEAARRLAAIGRDDPRYHLARAQELVAAGDTEAALLALRASLAVEPSAAAWVGLGVVLDSLGRSEEALQAFGHGVALAPADARAWHLLGRTLLRQGRLDASGEALRRAAALAPDDAGVAEDLARVRARRAESSGR